jgi:hypothetical protein
LNQKKDEIRHSIQHLNPPHLKAIFIPSTFGIELTTYEKPFSGVPYEVAHLVGVGRPVVFINASAPVSGADIIL